MGVRPHDGLPKETEYVNTTSSTSPIAESETATPCRFCAGTEVVPVLDLGEQPLANSYLTTAQVRAPELEPKYPLRVRICTQCWLVQLEDFARREDIFNEDYSYYSSFSSTWLSHASDYVEKMTDALDLDGSSLVVELASNDGYLLRNFDARHIPVLGVEPCAGVALAARAIGVRTEIMFFGTEAASQLAASYGHADLIVANNVLAHVPDLNDFVGGIKVLLKPEGTVTIEAPHLLQLLREGQFDTIYHEHYSYFSLAVLCRVFAAHGLAVVNVEELETHGGSLRTFVRHDGAQEVDPNVARVLRAEKACGLESLDTYRQFGTKVESVRDGLRDFLTAAARSGRRVAAYGAPAKGNTLLNYCGVGPSDIEFTVDASPHKQGMYLPGSHIPIGAPQRIRDERPDDVVILPWNLRKEITKQMADAIATGTKFWVAIPSISVA